MVGGFRCTKCGYELSVEDLSGDHEVNVGVLKLRFRDRHRKERPDCPQSQAMTNPKTNV